MVKNQHYVPKFYLKHFTDADEKLWVFDKFTQRTFRTTPQQVANENFFYDMPEIDIPLEEEQVVERYLSEMEGLHAPFFKQLLSAIDNQKIDRIDSDIRSILCDHMVIQCIRTKENRERRSQGYLGFMEAIIEKGWIPKEEHEAFRSTMHPEQAKFDHLKEILFDREFKDKLYDILNAHIWIVCKNISGTPYYTSDHPVVKQPHLRRLHRSDSGYRSKGIEIAMPLSSTHLLVLFERTHHHQFIPYDNDIILHHNPQNVIYYNSLQVSRSYRSVFCAEKNFDMAEEMVITHPELREPNRKRMGFS